MGAGQGAHQRLRLALDGIAAGLALPFAAGDIPVDLAALQALEGDGAGGNAAALFAIRADQGEAGQDLMAPAGQKGKAAARLCLGFGLGQDAVAAGDHRIGSEDEGGIGKPGAHGRSLAGGKAERQRLGRFVGQRGFVEIGGDNPVRRQAESGQQLAPAGRRRGENEQGAVTHGQRPGRLA